MVTLSSPHDYVVLFAVAALFGAIGGVAYELAQNRSGSTGSLSLPSVTKWSALNLGFVSSIVLGAIAAVAVSYFFTPEVQVTKVVGHATKVVTEWQIVKVVPLSLIVGSSGGAFLASLRSRVLAELKTQEVEATKAAGNTAVEATRAAGKLAVAQVASIAKAAATKHTTGAAARIVADGVGEISDAALEVPKHFTANLLGLPPEQRTPLADIIVGQPEPPRVRIA